MTLALVALSVALSAALAVHTSSRCPWRHRDARWLACAGCWFDAPWYAWRWARRGFRPYDEEEE